MSLREKQKAHRSREIVNAAATLFGKKGYSNTSIEDIASHAFVAPGTVYNYFGTKNGILQRIVELHIADRRVERARFISNPPEDLDDAIVAYVDLLLDKAFVLVNREIWRQILASTITSGTGRPDLHEGVTGELVSQFESLFTAYSKRGAFSSDVVIRDLAEAAMGIADFHFYRYVCSDEDNIEQTKASIVRQIRILLKSVHIAHSND